MEEETSKVSGSGTDCLYASSCRFYVSLHFLKDNLTPRPTGINNIEQDIEEQTIYPIDNSPSEKSARKIQYSEDEREKRESAESVIEKASKAFRNHNCQISKWSSRKE